MLKNRRILFISGSFGLGHIIRDLEIAKELRSQIPDTEIIWLTSDPARTFLTGKGETVHSEINRWSAETEILENMNMDGTGKKRLFHSNLMRFLIKSRHAWAENVRLFDEIMKKESYDLVIGDETYELVIALRDKVISINTTFVIIFDFIGVDVMTKNPIEKLIAYRLNYRWAKGNRKVPERAITKIFIGEPSDIPDKRFGLWLANRKENVMNNHHFVGYILPFDPEVYKYSQTIRERVRPDVDRVIVCAVGGTSIGLPLLELCCKAFSLVKEKIPGARMLIVSGPRISTGLLKVPEGVILKGYVPDLFECFAECDLAVVQGGSTTTLELTALNKPFIYFPIEGHFEQQLHVAPRLERLKAGIKMQFSQTTPGILADKIVNNIGKKVNYPALPLGGAKKAVKVIRHIIES